MVESLGFAGVAAAVELLVDVSAGGLAGGVLAVVSGDGVLLGVVVSVGGVDGVSVAALGVPVDSLSLEAFGSGADRRAAGFAALVLATLFDVLFALGATGSGAGAGVVLAAAAWLVSAVAAVVTGLELASATVVGVVVGPSAWLTAGAGA